jgi:hypothetical protein
LPRIWEELGGQKSKGRQADLPPGENMSCLMSRFKSALRKMSLARALRQGKGTVFELNNTKRNSVAGTPQEYTHN